MPKKPRANKRPPPKPVRPTVAHPPSNPNLSSSTTSANLPYLESNQPIDLSALVPPPTTIDPNDPNFPSALSDWSASALGKLNQLPKLSQSQLSAIAGAAAGVRNPALFSQSSGMPNGNLPIDLPASLAALFEAKLTLDREKAKLMQMQRELKSHRDSLLAANKMDKGKNVAKEDQEDECTCGRHGHVHDYPASAHSGEGSDEYYYETDEECLDDCDCDCHHGYEHEHDCDCGHCVEDPDGDDQCHHHHHHRLPDEDSCRHETFTEADSVVNDANDIAAQVRQATAELKTATAQANRAAANQIRQVTNSAPREIERKSLAEDPERLDELVRELFNWIKAVVWTIEQAALVAGRRNWAQQST